MAGRRRDHSMDSVFSSMLSAALDARYAYQPPRRLSSMLPTRADRLVKIGVSLLRSSGSSALASRSAPSALTSKANRR